MPRAFADSIWRAILALVRSLVAWIPALLILVFGIVYLIDCANVLLAPGNAVKYEYEAVGGRVVLRAESYSIDPWRRRGQMRGVTLTDPAGHQVIAVDRADVVYQDGIVNVQTGAIQAKVVRKEDGKFDFEDALPKPTDEESSAILTVAVSQLDVDYEDRTQSPPLRQPLTLERLRADVSKGDVVVAANLTTPGLPQTPITAQVDADGALWIEAEFRGTDVLALRPIVARWVNLNDYPEVRDIQARSLRATGKVRFAKDKDGKFNIWADGSVDGDGLILRPYLQNAQVAATVVTDAQIMNGTISVREAGRQADFRGELILGSPFSVAGQLEASVSQRSRLWTFLLPMVPKEVDFRSGEFRGPIRYDGRQVVASGDLTARELTLWGETVTDVVSRVSLDAKMVAANIERAQYSGFRANGMVRLNPETQALTGFVETNEGRLEDLAARFDLNDLRGVGKLRATLSGTVSKPEAEILASGTAAWRREGQWINAGEFEARGKIDEGLLTVRRLALDGPVGVFSGSGTLNLETTALDMKVDAGGFELLQIDPALDGLAFVRGDLDGKLADPIFTGRAEVVGVSYQDRQIPAASANIVADTRQIKVEKLEARLGTGIVFADGTYTYEGGQIAGQVRSTGVLIADIIPADLVGRIAIEDGEIEGTIENPILTGRLVTSDLIAFGVPVESLRTAFRATRDQVEVESGRARLGEGEVLMSGTYDFGDGTAVGQFTVDNVPLEKIPGQNEGLIFDGSISGSGKAALAADATYTAEFDGTVDSVEVNGTLIGSGSVNAAVEEGFVKAEASLGSIERYITLLPSTYHIGTRHVEAGLEAYNFEIADIVQAALPKAVKISDQARQTLESLKGALSLTARANGPVDNIAVAVPDLVADDLTVGGREFGELRASVVRDDGIWTASRMQWRAGDSVLSMNGTYDEGGPISAIADLANFDLTLLNALAPSIPLISGTASMTAVASGTTDDPQVRASLSLGSLGTVSDGTPIRIPLSAELGEIVLEDDVVTAQGQAFFKGFTGSLTARVPLAAFGDSPQDQISGSLILAERDLDAFQEYATMIDPARSEGKVTGVASVAGPANDLRFNVDVALSAKQVAFAGQTPTLNDVELTLVSDAETATIQGEVRSSLGGFADIEVAASLADILSGEVGLDEFLEQSTLSGKLVADNFRWQTKLPNADRASDATADGEITVSGGFLQPRIGGRVEVSGVTVSVPSELPPAGPAPKFIVNPIFDNLTVVAAPNSTILVSLGRVGLTGSGTINGTLEYPEIRAPLTIESGSFRLPTSRIKLEPGGTVNVVYAGEPPVPRVDLAITGTTTVTARQTTDNYQTYFVTLDIRGNLLDPDGLRIQGTSDPADLTNAQILALIGQKDLIESLAASAFGNRDGLRDTLFSLAIPSLTLGITEGIASTLQLDYLTIDYNPFDQAVIRAGKTLTDNLMLQVSRQLVEPQQGKLKYEVKLTYRLPVKDEFFSKLRLGFGFDQDRPWKFTLDWSRRF